MTDQTPTPTEQQDVCPACGSTDRFIVKRPCASDAWDPNPWHRLHPLAAVSVAAPDERGALAKRLARDLAWHGPWEVYLPTADWIIQHDAALAARPAPVVSGDLTREIDAWHRETFPGKTDTDVALKLAEEAGEVAGAQVRCDEIATGTRDGDADAARAHLAKELGDLAIVWLTLCARHDLDAEAVVLDRWATIQTRRWTVAGAPAADDEGGRE